MNFQGNIGDIEVQHLAQALYSNASLTHLDLTANFIGDDGAKRLADVLRHNKTLKKLVLRHNFIQRNGLHALAEALIENTTMDDIQVGISNSDHFVLLLTSLASDWTTIPPCWEGNSHRDRLIPSCVGSVD